MIDEGKLREHFSGIPWDQPVPVSVGGFPPVWVCRYCIARHGLRAQEIKQVAFSFHDRGEALDHIEQAHHAVGAGEGSRPSSPVAPDGPV